MKKIRGSDFNGYKDAIETKIGKRIFYIWEIENMTDHLGDKVSERTIRQHLQKERINVRMSGVDARQYHTEVEFVYTESAVFDYLKYLEKKGVINLGDSKNIDDILFYEYNKPRIRKNPYEKKKHVRKKLENEDMDIQHENIWDDAVKIYEND